MKRRMNSVTEKTELDKRLKNIQTFEKKIETQVSYELCNWCSACNLAGFGSWMKSFKN